MEIVFATANANKVKEVQALLEGTGIKILSLKDIGCEEDVPETQDTFAGNAIQKAEYVAEHYKVNCFSEDTGLVVDALNGAPGVYTARYAGPEKDNDANIALLLKNLKGETNRAARFQTVIALHIDGKNHLFEGIAEGTISIEKKGTDGFGYDPVFIPEGYNTSFAEMALSAKNTISHRKKAVAKLIEFLR